MDKHLVVRTLRFAGPSVVPALALTAGYVDAVGYLTFNVFTAHMSGNSARLGVYLGRVDAHDALVAAFAVGVFVASIVAGTVVMEIGTERHRTAMSGVLLVTEAALLVIFAVVAGLGEVHGHLPARPASRFYGLVACAVTAIGLQTASLQRLSGQPVRTTFVSGMLTTLADEVVATFALGDGRQPRRSYVGDELGLRAESSRRSRMALLASIWLAYVAGATFGTMTDLAWNLACLAIPVVVLLGAAAAVTADRRGPRRT